MIQFCQKNGKFETWEKVTLDFPIYMDASFEWIQLAQKIQ